MTIRDEEVAAKERTSIVIFRPSRGRVHILKQAAYWGYQFLPSTV